jgi:hypothetical protein
MLRERTVRPVAFASEAVQLQLRELDGDLSGERPVARASSSAVAGRSSNRGCERFGFGSASIPKASSRSAAHVSGVAPSRSSAFVRPRETM